MRFSCGRIDHAACKILFLIVMQTLKLSAFLIQLSLDIDTKNISGLKAQPI